MRLNARRACTGLALVAFSLPAPAKGLRMPALSHLSRKEAEAVWYWMRAVASQKLNAYEP